MANDADQGRIQNSIENLKRRLQREREESETLTHNLSFRRDQAPPMEDSRMKKLEAELAAAQKELAEQKAIAEQSKQQLAKQQTSPQRNEELATAQIRLQDQKTAAEQLIQQLAAERDESRGRLREMEIWTRTLGDELATTRQQLSDQQQTAETVRQLTSERDQDRTHLAEAESRARGLEEELAAARQQLSDQQQTAETIRQLTAERDESRAQLSDVESRIQVLGEELAAAQEQSREQREAVGNFIQRLEAERDETGARLREQEERAQKLEEELAATRQQLQEQINVATAAEKAAGERQALLSQGVGGQVSALDRSANGQPDLWRIAASLTLVLMSSDLLALNHGSCPETQEAVREIQLGSQKLLDFLRNFNSQSPTPQPTKSDQPAETPRETTGAFGTITPA